MNQIKLLLSGCLLLGLGQAQAFQSEIFSYDAQDGNPGYLHVAMQGNGWRIEDIKELHSPFHQNLFNNPEVMSGFADGQVRAPEATHKRIIESWIPRFQKGQPHGGLSLFNGEDQLIGCVVGGGGEREGTSEIAATLDKSVWHTGIAADLAEKTVTVWAPEVRRIGLGIGLTEQDVAIKNAFCCFMGKPLQWLDATASPSNVASWSPMIKNGFKPALWNRQDQTIDLSTSVFEGRGDADKFTQYKAMEAYILETYFKQDEEKIAAGQRCILLDHQGTEWTLSKHERWHRLKFHFEYQVQMQH